MFSYKVFSLWLVFLALQTTASAQSRRYEFTGTVSEVDPLVNSSFAVGDTYTLSFDVLLNIPDFFPDDPNFATYSFTNFLLEFSNENAPTTELVFGGLTILNNLGEYQGFQGIDGSDTFSISFGSGIFDGSVLDDVDLFLADLDGTAFSDDSLPTTLNLSDFEISKLDLSFSDPASATVSASIDSITIDGVGAEPDNDGDGIPDSTDPDDDNDGSTDADEAIFGTDPFDPTSQFVLTLVPHPTSANQLELSFETLSGREYQIHQGSLPGTIDSTTTIVGDDSLYQFTIDLSEADPLFFQVEAKLLP